MVLVVLWLSGFPDLLLKGQLQQMLGVLAECAVQPRFIDECGQIAQLCSASGIFFIVTTSNWRSNLFAENHGAEQAQVAMFEQRVTPCCR